MSLIPEKRFLELTEKFNKLDPIIIVGDIGIDKYTLGEVSRISPEAPVPVLEVYREWEKLGLAANISHNLSTLGVNSTLCGIIGDDNRGNNFEHLLEESKLKTWGLVRDVSRTTIFKERITTSTQQICRIDYENSDYINTDISNKLFSRVEEFSGSHSSIILEDYAKGTLTEEMIKKVIALGKETGKLVCVDPGRTTPPDFYKGAGLLKPNLLEAKLMVEFLGFTYQDTKLEEMAEILVDKLDIEKLVITLGKDGMALFDKKGTGKLSIIPTVAQEVFDVSGAGDTTISLLVAGLMAGGSLEESAWIANCGAGVVVAKKGTATVNFEELNTFYQKLQNSYS